MVKMNPNEFFMVNGTPYHVNYSSRFEKLICGDKVVVGNVSYVVCGSAGGNSSRLGGRFSSKSLCTELEFIQDDDSQILIGFYSNGNQNKVFTGNEYSINDFKD